jgi:glycosyltransferase involved in cell wall biosynthesis
MKQLISHGQNGILVRPHKPKELAQALLELMQNKNLREKIALKGTQIVKNYDIRSVAPKISEIYENILKS